MATSSPHSPLRHHVPLHPSFSLTAPCPTDCPVSTLATHVHTGHLGSLYRLFACSPSLPNGSPGASPWPCPFSGSSQSSVRTPHVDHARLHLHPDLCPGPQSHTSSCLRCLPAVFTAIATSCLKLDASFHHPQSQRWQHPLPAGPAKPWPSVPPRAHGPLSGHPVDIAHVQKLTLRMKHPSLSLASRHLALGRLFSETSGRLPGQREWMSGTICEQVSQFSARLRLSQCVTSPQTQCDASVPCSLRIWRHPSRGHQHPLGHPFPAARL